MNKVLDDCIYAYIIGIINITLSFVMINSYKIYDEEGNEIIF